MTTDSFMDSQGAPPRCGTALADWAKIKEIRGCRLAQAWKQHGTQDNAIA